MNINVSGIWDNIFKRKQEEVEKNVIDIIKDISLFQNLTHRELRNVAQSAYIRHYEPFEAIIKEGQSSAGMYIIMNGEAEIFKQSQDGVKTVLGHLEESDIFGELGLIDNSPRNATVTAITSTTVISFLRTELLKLIDENPKTASKLIFKLAQIIAERLRYTDEKLQKAIGEIKRLRSMLPEDIVPENTKQSLP